eukprot:3716633-Alexandrium_andersonii.AAC.1
MEWLGNVPHSFRLLIRYWQPGLPPPPPGRCSSNLRLERRHRLALSGRDGGMLRRGSRHRCPRLDRR